MANIKYQSSSSANCYLFPALSNFNLKVPVVNLTLQKIRKVVINNLKLRDIVLLQSLSSNRISLARKGLSRARMQIRNLFYETIIVFAKP